MNNLYMTKLKINGVIYYIDDSDENFERNTNHAFDRVIRGHVKIKEAAEKIDETERSLKIRIHFYILSNNCVVYKQWTKDVWISKRYFIRFDLPSEGKEFTVPEWFADKNHIKQNFIGKILKETEKAIRVIIDNKFPIWIPKSII
jgi:hypothetical protein